MKQFEKADQLGYSSSTLQRYRNDTNMLSPYGIQPDVAIKQSALIPIHIVNMTPKRPQMTSIDFAKPETNTEAIVKHSSNKGNENFLKGGSLYKDIELDDKNLDEVLHNNNLQVEFAMQIISNDQTVRSNTVQELKDFNSQSLATRAEEG